MQIYCYGKNLKEKIAGEKRRGENREIQENHERGEIADW